MGYTFRSNLLIYYTKRTMPKDVYNSHYEKLPNGEVRCIDDEIPFEIPSSWAWCRIATLCNITNGFTPLRTEPKYWYNGTINWFTVEDIRKQGEEINYTEQKITEVATTEERIVRAGSTLLCCTASVGQCAITRVPLTTNQQFNALTIKEEHRPICNDNYLFLFARTLTPLLHLLAGKTTFEFISVKKVGQILFPLPPIKEQNRIVLKIDALLPIIDKYAQTQQELDNLNSEIYDLLKKSILQEAIQGRLVPQDPSDEPATKLLERIRTEKQALVKQGKLKAKDITDSIIYKGDDNKYYEKCGNAVTCIDDEIPFEIPSNWQWIRLQTVSSIARGGSPRPIKDYLTTADNGVNWIKIGDTEKNGKYINATKEKIKQEGVSKSRLIHRGDFLLTNSMSFGRPYISNIEGCIHDGWLVISPYSNCYNQDFLFHLLSSQYAYQQFSGKVSGAVVQNLNSDKVSQALFPLPPLAEQQRIVSKLDDALASIMSR